MGESCMWIGFNQAAFIVLCNYFFFVVMKIIDKKPLTSQNPSGFLIIFLLDFFNMSKNFQSVPCAIVYKQGLLL